MKSGGGLVMLKRFMSVGITMMVRRAFREEVRLQGLKAVRTYIAAVGLARQGVMAAVALIAVVALLVAGLVLTVGAILALVPISEAAVAWTSLVVGLLLLIAGIVVLAALFDQKRWLELSRSYELIEAMVEPVPSAADVPKNLVRALKRQPTEHVLHEPTGGRAREPEEFAGAGAMPLRPSEA